MKKRTEEAEHLREIEKEKRPFIVYNITCNNGKVFEFGIDNPELLHKVCAEIMERNGLEYPKDMKILKEVKPL